MGGATASGKTALAIQLANILNTEIINCDSRQVYRELNIGVAKPTADELNMVHHHGVNVTSIEDHFSAGSFQQLVRPTLDSLLERHNHVVVTGGTGLYIQHLLFNVDETLQLNKPLQEIFSQKISPYNEKYQLHFLAIDIPREILYQRINQRVDHMVADGLLQEVENLVPKSKLKALQTVGYTELFNYFNGDSTLEQAIDLIKQHTRNYAKRQITYFKHQFPTQWHSPQQILEIVSNFAVQ